MNHQLCLARGSVRAPLWRRVSAMAVGLMALPAFGLPIDLGEVEGSFDTTLSAGLSVRLQSRDPRLVGVANGGLANSVNTDDGNLNYNPGVVSMLLKGTHDLQLNYRGFGVFARGSYFWDPVNYNESRERTKLSDAARDKVGANAEFLDYYLFGKFDAGRAPLSFRLGSHVLSWGESTFIPNGINVINPVDVSKLRGPGNELKEALKPTPMASASLGLTENLTLEGFYQFKWADTEIEPGGTYFATNDFASPGGRTVYLGFGRLSDLQSLGGISRAQDRDASDSGQFGFAARLLAPRLGNTEFGVYFLNYHSRLPLISAITPPGPVSAAAVQQAASALGQSQLAPALIAGGIPQANVPAALSTLLGAALTGAPVGALPANLRPFYPAATQIANGARQQVFLQTAAGGRYVVEYPEDIDLLGASFNTELFGLAFQGELSYRHNQPLQLDDVELLFAALGSLNPAFAANNQIGNFFGRYSTTIKGWRREEVWTGQLTATKIFGPTLGANQLLVLGEIGGVLVPSLPRVGQLRYDASGTYTSGNPAAMVGTGNGAIPATSTSDFADRFSFGYQLLGRLDYTNLFAGVNVSPALAFSHDVIGNTPLPLGNFLQNRKSLTVSAELVWQNAWSIDLRYTNFLGAGAQNLLRDRDFASATLKYSF